MSVVSYPVRLGVLAATAVICDPSAPADPLTYEIIKLYSEVPVLLEIIEALNRHSKELARDDGIAQQARRIKAVSSILTVLIPQCNGFIGRIRNLVEKLPA